MRKPIRCLLAGCAFRKSDAPARKATLPKSFLLHCTIETGINSRGDMLPEGCPCTTSMRSQNIPPFQHMATFFWFNHSQFKLSWTAYACLIKASAGKQNQTWSGMDWFIHCKWQGFPDRENYWRTLIHRKGVICLKSNTKHAGLVCNEVFNQ